MEAFLGGALIIAWVIVLLWVVAKSAARALRGDQFNSGPATGLICRRSDSGWHSLVYQKFVVLARYDRRGLFVFAPIGSVTLIASVRNAK
jgi:hypothetical protein